MKFKHLIYLVLSCLLATASLSGCSKTSGNVTLDLSNMDESSFYSAVDSSSVVEIDGNIYVGHWTRPNNDLPKTNGIYRCDNGQMTLIYEGDIIKMHRYDRWIYCLVSEENATNLYRVNVDSEEAEFVREGMWEYIICPAGIFWEGNTGEDVDTTRQIMWSSLDGAEKKVFYRPNQNVYIGVSCIYNNTLYFVLFNKALDSIQYYRMDLRSSEIEPMEEASLWKVDSSETKLSSADNSTILYKYEYIESFFGGDDGWLYLSPKTMWYSPDTKREELAGGEHFIYKIKENGRDLTKLDFVEILHERAFLAVNDGWLYYHEDDENANNTICRIKEDGSDPQVIVKDNCIYGTIIDNYLYYYLLNYNDNRELVEKTLYRVSLDTLSNTEKLY